MTENKFEHEDYYLVEQAKLRTQHVEDICWISVYSAAIVAGKCEDACGLANQAVRLFRERPSLNQNVLPQGLTPVPLSHKT